MCTRPIILKRKLATGQIVNQKVPCGKCTECVKQYQNQWYLRFAAECKGYPTVIFFTLTYNEDSVLRFKDEEDGTIVRSVNKKDVQNWIKRARRSYEYKFGTDLDMKYYITSEYGPKTHRPHYHGLFMSKVPYVQFGPIFKDWQDRYGFVNYSQAINEGAVSRYVSKYCAKGKYENPYCTKLIKDLTPEDCPQLRENLESKMRKKYSYKNYVSDVCIPNRIPCRDRKRKYLLFIKRKVNGAVAKYIETHKGLGNISKTFHLISKGIGNAERELIRTRFQNELTQKWPDTKRYSNEDGKSFLGYSTEFLDWYISQRKITMYGFGDKAYNYNMPRSWRDYKECTLINKEKKDDWVYCTTPTFMEHGYSNYPAGWYYKNEIYDYDPTNYIKSPRLQFDFSPRSYTLKLGDGK